MADTAAIVSDPAVAIGSSWPVDSFPISEGVSAGLGLRAVGLSQLDLRLPDQITATVVILEELSFDLPGLSGFSLVFGSTEGRTEIHVELGLRDPFELTIRDFPIRLRFPGHCLPVVRGRRQLHGSPGWIPRGRCRRDGEL
jgi:hypothetical protein